MEYTIYTELVAVRSGIYTLYVFQNLDTQEFIMCTKLPNWQTPVINIGDKGFLLYKIVEAGDKYFNLELGIEEIYRYSNIYFLNFVLKTTDLTNTNILW